MNNQILNGIVDFILNRAEDGELEIIAMALEKRSKQASSPGFAGMAGKMAKQVNQQLSLPREQIKQMVRSMVVNMIKQQVPDIPDEHMEALLKEWVPDQQPQKSSLPEDVLKTMIRHFVLYSTNRLSPRDIAQLKKSMPNWEEEYWNHFPGSIRGLITKLLQGEIDEALFWATVDESLKK